MKKTIAMQRGDKDWLSHDSLEEDKYPQLQLNTLPSSSQYTVDTLQLLTLGAKDTNKSTVLPLQNKSSECLIKEKRLFEIVKILQAKKLPQETVKNEPHCAESKVFQSTNTMAVYLRYIAQGNKSCETCVFSAVKEVLTDGADAARQPTDIQY